MPSENGSYHRFRPSGDFISILYTVWMRIPIHYSKEIINLPSPPFPWRLAGVSDLQDAIMVPETDRKE